MLVACLQIGKADLLERWSIREKRLQVVNRQEHLVLTVRCAKSDAALNRGWNTQKSFPRHFDVIVEVRRCEDEVFQIVEGVETKVVWRDERTESVSVDEEFRVKLYRLDVRTPFGDQRKMCAVEMLVGVVE